MNRSSGLGAVLDGIVIVLLGLAGSTTIYTATHPQMAHQLAVTLWSLAATLLCGGVAIWSRL